MAKEAFWKRELREVLVISSTFFVFFVLFVLLKKALLAQHHIQIHTFGTAIIGALVLGKVVLIIDKLPLTKRLDQHKKIYSVFYRSFLYLLGYILLAFLEHTIKALIMGEGFSEAFSHALHSLVEIEFLASLVAVWVVLLFFSSFWVVRNHIGPGELYKLFFKGDKS